MVSQYSLRSARPRIEDDEPPERIEVPEVTGWVADTIPVRHGVVKLTPQRIRFRG